MSGMKEQTSKDDANKPVDRSRRLALEQIAQLFFRGTFKIWINVLQRLWRLSSRHDSQTFAHGSF